MTYDLLWTAFQPGCFVYTKVQGQDRIFRLYGSQYGRDRNQNPVFWLTLQYIDYDGTRFGTNKLNMNIMSYDGTKAFATLAALPLERHAQEEAMRKKLIERGAKVEGFAGSHYRSYNGVGWRVNNTNQTEKYSIKGRIVIDTYGWNRFNPNQSVYVTQLNLKDSPTATGFSANNGDNRDDGADYGEYDGGGQNVDDDCGIPLDGFFIDEDEGEAKITLSDEQKMMCAPAVRGYALKDKIWLNFFVNAVQDISFNTKAFESLVLPANQKELILGFTLTQQSYRTQFDDVIEGKGRGMCIDSCSQASRESLTASQASSSSSAALPASAKP